ncbi:MAG: ATP-binding cassette domain-containing protein [Candidatus Thermoplasmatota archaeon]|nr:ATP-binding cassette domain-containing protein [Candidatus Thermoplasmatota archaeon]
MSERAGKKLQVVHRLGTGGESGVREEPSSPGSGRILVRDLSFSYTGAPESSLEADRFEAGEGEVILITGRSGSGKSTLVNCINGVIPHIFHGNLSGTVMTSGLTVGDTPLFKISSHVGTLLQDPTTQVLNYTVEEEVAFGPENLCLQPEEIASRVKEAIDITGMNTMLDRETYTLSGGEMQRLAFASVLAMKPEILILDEPTSNIDPEGTEKIFELLKSLARKKTILVVEHKVERVLTFVDRIILVDGGRITLDIEKKDLPDHLEDLISAGIEIPEHYLVARKLGIDATDVQSVRKIAAESGLNFRSPDRSVTGKMVLNAHSIVHSDRPCPLVDTGFSLFEGEMLAIMGRNGAGKSTLLNSLCGMLDMRLKAEISLRVGDNDLSFSSVQEVGRHIAYIPQAFDIVLINSTVEDEISYSMRKRGRTDRKQLRERTEYFLKMFSLWEVKDRDPLTLSFGQRRRVAMASALSSGARIVMMDEPTSGQDFYHREMLGKELSSLRSQGVSFVVVTHDARFVYRHANMMMIMDGGKKVIEGTPEECFRESEKYGIIPPSDFLVRCG